MWILLSFFLTTSSYSAFVALDNSALNQLKTKCEKGSKEACTKFFNNSPLRTFDYWKNNLTKQSVPIFEAPDALLEYLKLDNKNNGYNETPLKTKIDPAFLKDIKSAFIEIPEHIRNLLNGTLVGIFIVKNLGSTAYSLDLIIDTFDHHPYGLIVLDVDKLSQNANSWATQKENSPFKPSKNWSIHVEIENKQNNNRKNAIQFILLHELAHVFDFRNKVTPQNWISWDKFKISNYPFMNLSWVYNNSEIERKNGPLEDITNSMRFYAEEDQKLPIQDASTIYSELQYSSFPTLYASTNAGEDFAESFATYVHTVLMKKPYKTILSKDNKTVLIVTPCWREPRCKEKEKLLENILKSKN